MLPFLLFLLYHFQSACQQLCNDANCNCDRTFGVNDFIFLKWDKQHNACKRQINNVFLKEEI